MCRPDRSPGVDLDERARGRRLHETEPEKRQRRPDHDREEGEEAGRFARDAADRVDPPDEQPLQAGDQEHDRDQQEAEPDEQPRPL